MEEKKKKFIDPATWAKHCLVLALIEIAFILLWIVSGLAEIVLGADNCISNLFRVIAVPLLFIFFILLFAIFIGGISSLVGLLVTKERTKKPYLYSIISIVASILLFGFMAIGFIKSKNATMEMLCHNTLGYLNKQVLQKLEANNKILTKESWCDFIKAEVEYDSAFKCYGDRTGPCSYAMNENIPADANELPRDLVLLFESAPGWNQTGGADDVVADRHGNAAANIAFADGHVEFVETEDIPKLRWTVEKQQAVSAED